MKCCQTKCDIYLHTSVCLSLYSVIQFFNIILKILGKLVIREISPLFSILDFQRFLNISVAMDSVNSLGIVPDITISFIMWLKVLTISWENWSEVSDVILSYLGVFLFLKNWWLPLLLF